MNGAAAAAVLNTTGAASSHAATPAQHPPVSTAFTTRTASDGSDPLTAALRAAVNDSTCSGGSRLHMHNKNSDGVPYGGMTMTCTCDSRSN